jgi:membrane associated rhomboid family serine protease
MADSRNPPAPTTFRLRAPGVWSPPLLKLLLAFGLLVVAPALLRGLESGRGPFGPPVRPGIAVAALSALAGLVVVLWIRLRPRRLEPVRLLEDALLVPISEASSRVARLGYGDLHWLEALGAAPARRMLLGARGGARIVLRERSFAEAGGFERFAAELSGRIAGSERGAERLRELEARAAEASVLRRRWPVLTVTIVTLLAAAYAAQVAGGAVSDPLAVIRFGGNAPALVARGELFRLVTANFLHGSVLHFYWNAIPIAIIGARLERLLGPAGFGLLAGTGALAGTLASAWAAAGLVSAGASTLIFTLIASVVWLNARAADGLPPGLRFPLPAALVVLVAIVLSSLLVSNVDHASHAGGFVAGIGATAALARRESGRRLVCARRRGVAAAALALAGLFALGIADGIRNARAPAGTGLLAWAEALAGDESARPHLLNEVAWVLATTPEVPEDRIALAVAVAERALLLEPDSGAIQDTLATAHFRAGNLERAIELEREIATRDGLPFYWSQLARFEWEYARRWGPLRLGGESFPMPWFEGARLAHRGDRPFEAHAVVLEGERILGSLLVTAGPGAASPLPMELPADLPPEARIELVLVDAETEPDPATGSTYVPFHPEAAELP